MKRGLRIIAGERRGWKIEAPAGTDVTRPISDRVKENLFNIIQTLVPQAVVLDLFAGTGSLGLEALSRGARWCTFVEQHLEIAALLKQNVAHLGYETAARVITTNVLHLRPGVRQADLSATSGAGGAENDLVFDLVFVDPPYRMMEDGLTRTMLGEALARLAGFGALAQETTIVARHERRCQFKYNWPGLELARSRHYGTMTLDFLRPVEKRPAREAAEHGS